jgi:predicted AlkP superfamily pyrophosphatase or phosphodiesterase
MVAGAGYINSDNDPATGTALYDIDTGLDTLVMQNPPNAGTLITIGSLGIDANSVGGFDVRAQAGSAVRLVVIVAVDQMIPEQLERLAPLLHGGLGRFVREGTIFREARYQYATTETAAGHATYGTGLNPLHHGIVANDWVLPDEKSPSYCVGDPDVRLVSGKGLGSSASMSPRNLRGVGLIDRLKQFSPASKGFAVSSKDRSAIGLSGQHADLALWWNRVDGGFVSSSWYTKALPPWLLAFDAQWLESFQREWGGGWHALEVESFAGTDTADDDSAGELPWKGSRVLPYPAPEIPAVLDARARLELATVVYGSPAADQFVCELARRALVEMDLGGDEHVDVLCVSLSSCDTVGHSFGPRSREVTDVLLRADRQLELLFADIDQRVGAGHWIASLSADHGVMELPEALVERGIGAERVSGRAFSAAVRAMREELQQSFGDDFVLAYDASGVRLSWTRIQAAGKKLAEVRALAAKSVQAAAGAWLERAWTWDELERVARKGESADGWKRSQANSFDEERTPDLVFQFKPWTLIAMDSGTTHGSTYPYDQRVPLAFLGPGFAARSVYGPASPVDALPTLMAALGLELPAGLDGRNLVLR